MLNIFHPEAHALFETLGYAAACGFYRYDDCGLCPDHEQHSCLTLLEICDACNLNCPICFADSGTHRTTYKPRVLIVQFIDAQTFDLRSIKKTCVHIAHPDAQRLIPFDTYNMFYRDDLEQSRLEPLRERTLAAV